MGWRWFKDVTFELDVKLVDAFNIGLCLPQRCIIKVKDILILKNNYYKKFATRNANKTSHSLAEIVLLSASL